MKNILCIFLASSVAVLANSKVPAWHPPTKGDVRSPCPGINVLSNHGILPRNGKNLERQVVVDALSKWYNIAEPISTGLFDLAVNFSGKPGAPSFDMVDIWLHHNATVPAIEGDASFSRADYFWGDNHSFNRTVWKQTRSFWTGETIDVQKFGNAANARYTTSKATNPTFYFNDITAIGMAMAFMTSVLGDAVAGTVPTKFVNDWIVNERLPVKFGWSTNERRTDQPTVKDLAGRIFVASGLPPPASKREISDRFFHAGAYF